MDYRRLAALVCVVLCVILTGCRKDKEHLVEEEKQNTMETIYNRMDPDDALSDETNETLEGIIEETSGSTAKEVYEDSEDITIAPQVNEESIQQDAMEKLEINNTEASEKMESENEESQSIKETIAQTNTATESNLQVQANSEFGSPGELD